MDRALADADTERIYVLSANAAIELDSRADGKTTDPEQSRGH